MSFYIYKLIYQLFASNIYNSIIIYINIFYVLNDDKCHRLVIAMLNPPREGGRGLNKFQKANDICTQTQIQY